METCFSIKVDENKEKQRKRNNVRSLEKRRQRSKDKRKRKREQKQHMMEEKVKLESKVLDLEHLNSILTREMRVLRKDKSKISLVTTSYAKSLKRMYQNKNYNINCVIKAPITFFKDSEVVSSGIVLGSGVFGRIEKGFIPSINQVVAIKVFDSKCSNPVDVQAETKLTMEMSGQKYFPFVFGLVQETNKLILEFIGNGDVSSPTLKEVIEKNDLKISGYIHILCDLVKALSALHNHGILHNDLHHRNILIRKKKFVKIIDFGKGSLISDPIIYNIKPGSDTQRKYNTHHRHLAYELRNKPGSKVSIESDIYSLGYIVDSVGWKIKCEKLISLSTMMLSESPVKRPPLSVAYEKLAIII